MAVFVSISSGKPRHIEEGEEDEGVHEKLDVEQNIVRDMETRGTQEEQDGHPATA